MTRQHRVTHLQGNIVAGPGTGSQIVWTTFKIWDSMLYGYRPLFLTWTEIRHTAKRTTGKSRVSSTTAVTSLLPLELPRYWTKDIYNINFNFGSEADLKNLSASLHARGMYLMIDVTVNQ